MKLKSFKDLETTSKVRTKDLVLPLRIDRVFFGKMALPEQFSSRKKYGVNWGNAGVPNDLFFRKITYTMSYTLAESFYVNLC